MFRLSKWYMDCVSADGKAVVVYWARLSWGVIRLKYAATLVHRNGAINESATLFGGKGPAGGRGSIDWRCGRLRTEGHWEALTGPVSRTLLASPEGNIEWHCLLPSSQARILQAGAAPLEGLGYVERLDMTLRPWQLPIRELRWGRFLSDRATVVWIDWRGPRPLTILLVNGKDAVGPDVGDTRLAWRGGRLEMEPGPVLRDGPLGTTTLARVPLVGWLTPRMLRDTHEHKRLRRGTLFREDGQVDTGWIIDEVVRFGGVSG